ncbi:MAG: polysaccharide deacetylase family protein [Limisphaerales bacterium]
MKPRYYTQLAPFQDLFLSGLPVITYHKLGPRPRGARLKGLYVGARLFDRQLAELRRAGFRSAILDDLEVGATEGARRVVLTFDDGFSSVLRHGLEPLRKHGFQAIQFLVAGRLGGRSEWQAERGEVREPLMDAAQVREWLAAGQGIGAHTMTHPRLTRIPAAAAREEIGASRRRLEDTFGVPVRHFCYPYGDWNAAVRDLVAEAGYTTACTVDFGVNPPDTPRFELRRVTARYQSRRLKDLVPWLPALWRTLLGSHLYC